MTIRNTHTFQYTAQEISNACKQERIYHEQRLAYWEQEQSRLVEQASKSGIKLTEQVYTGGKSVQISVDNDLNTKLQITSQKIKTHREKLDQYKIQADVYGSQPQSLTYNLDADDVMYFRLAGGPRDE